MPCIWYKIHDVNSLKPLEVKSSINGATTSAGYIFYIFY